MTRNCKSTCKFPWESKGSVAQVWSSTFLLILFCCPSQGHSLPQTLLSLRAAHLIDSPLTAQRFWTRHQWTGLETPVDQFLAFLDATSNTVNALSLTAAKVPWDFLDGCVQIYWPPLGLCWDCFFGAFQFAPAPPLSELDHCILIFPPCFVHIQGYLWSRILPILWLWQNMLLPWSEYLWLSLLTAMDASKAVRKFWTS